MDISGLHPAEGHCYHQYSQLYSASFEKSQIELIICLLPSCFHIRCQRTDLHRRQPIWLQHVGCLPFNNTRRTMWEHQMIMLDKHRAKTLNSGNPQIISIYHRGIVTRLHSHHFQVLLSSTTMHHSTWHQAYNQALRQPNDIRVMGHCGKDMISSKDVMVDLKCSTLSDSQDRGRHLHALLECHQHHLETILWFGQPLPPVLHMDNFPAHLWDPHLPPNETISGSCGTAQDRCCRDCGLGPITRDFLWRIRCRLWDHWFVGLGRGQRQSPNQLEANGILLEAICQEDGAAQH